MNSKLKPMLSKLITLLLLLGTFAFLKEAEERVTTVAKQELSRWASSFPQRILEPEVNTLNPYAQPVSLEAMIWSTLHSKDSTVSN